MECERNLLQKDYEKSTRKFFGCLCLLFFLLHKLNFHAGISSENAAARDEAICRVQELEEKLKVQEEKHKGALAAAEAETQELCHQTPEHEELLAARLRGMVEDLTVKDQLSRILIERLN
jgi:hypothetical protein